MSKRKDDATTPAGFGQTNPGQEPTPPPASGSAIDSPGEAAGKPPRQSNAPVCPNCHVPTRAAKSSQVGNSFFTYYRCPTCPYSAKVPRKSLKQRLADQQADERFSAR